jgi:hypothetical protein
MPGCSVLGNPVEYFRTSTARGVIATDAIVWSMRFGVAECEEYGIRTRTQGEEEIIENKAKTGVRWE